MRQWAGVAASARAVALRPRTTSGRAEAKSRAARNAPNSQHQNAEHLVADDALLLHTARLALSTARQMRQLSSVVSQTVGVPDTSRFAEGFKVIAQRDLPWTDDGLLHTWAMAITTMVDVGEEGQVAEHFRLQRVHLDACTSPALIREHVLECQVHRCWSGDCTNLRFAVTPELREVAQCVCRMLVAGGGRVRYGAAPRGPLERAVASSLTARIGPAASHRVSAE